MSRMQGFTLPADVVAAAAALQDRTSKLRAHAEAEGRRCYRITNAASADEAELLLYDDIGGWFGTYADEFVQELNAITAPRLTVRLNSPGGSVFQGLAIASALRTHPADITVRVDGIAASIASVIALAGDRLVVMPGSTLMIHEASGEAIGDASVMAKMAEVLDTLSDNIADMYAAKAGGTRAEWRQQMKDETWFLADDAVKAGLADEVGPSRTAPEEPEMRQQFDLTVYGYRGPKQAETEAPKSPPPTAPEVAPEEVPLTFNVGGHLDEQVIDALRAMVAKRDKPAVAKAAPKDVPEIVDAASPVHHTATEDRPWDAGPNEKRLPSSMTVKTAKAMYAWYDEAQVTDGEITKDSCSLPHHEVSADGKPGAANIPGVRNALSRLPQSDIPASQHDAVRRHLQAHLDDAKSADNAAGVDPTAEDTTEVRGEPGPELVVPVADVEPEAVAPEPAPVDEPADSNAEWAAAFARLTEPEPDPWAEAFAHLVNPQPSSSAATAAA